MQLDKRPFEIAVGVTVSLSPETLATLGIIFAGLGEKAKPVATTTTTTAPGPTPARPAAPPPANVITSRIGRTGVRDASGTVTPATPTQQVATEPTAQAQPAKKPRKKRVMLTPEMREYIMANYLPAHGGAQVPKFRSSEGIAKKFHICTTSVHRAYADGMAKLEGLTRPASAQSQT